MKNVGTTQERVQEAKSQAIEILDMLTKIETALIFKDSNMLGSDTVVAYVENTTEILLENITYLRESVSLKPNN